MHAKNSLHHLGIAPAMVLCALALALGASETPVESERPIERIFDGSERVILYQTSSHQGQDQMQELLRMVPGGEQFRVRNRTVNMPDEELRAFPIHVRRMSNTFGSQFRIQDENDNERLQRAVRELTEEREADRARGLQLVFYHCGHYNENQREGDDIQLLFNDRLAYQAMAEAHPDPRFWFLDTLTPTHAHFPATVRADGFHANHTANYLEGLEVVRAMCAYDGIPVPPAIETFVAERVAARAAMADLIRITYPVWDNGIDERVMVGDTITVHWEADTEQVPGVYVMLHAVFRDDYYASGLIPATDPSFGSYTWTVTLDLPRAGGGNNPRRWRPPQQSETTRIRRVHQDSFCFRIVTSNRDQAADVLDFSDRFTIDMSGRQRDEPRHFDINLESARPAESE